MKKHSLFFPVLLFIFAIALTAAYVPADDISRDYDRVIDSAYLLSESEKASLNKKLYEISEADQMDVIVVTTNTLGMRTAEQLADDLYDASGFGYGSTHDGILLLIAMGTREWHITTTGYGIEVFTDAGQAYISNAILPDLSEGNYYKAFSRFASLCDDFVKEAKKRCPL